MKPNEKGKVLFFVNIIAPYNIPLFNRLDALLNKNVLFFFDQVKEANRNWKIEDQDIRFLYTIENSPNIRRSAKAVNGAALFRTIYFPFFVLQRIWSYKPSVVLSIEFGLRTIFALIMCKLTGARIVVVSDVTPVTEANTGLVKRTLRKTIARRLNAAVARSYAAKSYLESLGIPSQSIIVAPYAIEPKNGLYQNESADVNNTLDLIKRKRQGKFCFIYSGHLVHSKGIDLLVNTVAKLPVSVQEKLLFVLAGGSVEELQQVGGSYDPKIFLPVGFVPNDHILSIYGLADCFILPTRSDTWALVVNEAVVADCPVMVSKYAGSAGELIIDGESGIVFDPLNEKEFADKLMFCLENKEKLTFYSQKAKEKLSEYNNEVSAERIAGLIESLHGR